MNIHFAILEFRLRRSMIVLGFPGGLAGKESAYNAGDIGNKGLVPGLGRSLEKEMTTHSSFLAWEIPWTKEPDGVLLHIY